MKPIFNDERARRRAVLFEAQRQRDIAEAEYQAQLRRTDDPGADVWDAVWKARDQRIVCEIAVANALHELADWERERRKPGPITQAHEARGLDRLTDAVVAPTPEPPATEAATLRAAQAASEARPTPEPIGDTTALQRVLKEQHDLLRSKGFTGSFRKQVCRERAYYRDKYPSHTPVWDAGKAFTTVIPSIIIAATDAEIAFALERLEMAGAIDNNEIPPY